MAPTSEPVTEQPEGAGGTPAHALQGRRILIVDDNVDAAESFAALLRLLDNHVRTAGDGPEAFRIASEHRPEIVLVDICLPGMSGYDVARALRRDFGECQPLMLAMSGYGEKDEVDVGLFDAYLVKPVEISALEKMVAARRSGKNEGFAQSPGVAEINEGSGSQGHTRVPASDAVQLPSDARSRRVMVADDSEAVRSSLAAILSELGHDVRLAEDGMKAVEIAEDWKPDLAIIDVHMPKLSGYDVARRLRVRFPPKAMQLVMMCGTGLDETTRLGARQVGFDRCVDKALVVSELDALLRVPGSSGPGDAKNETDAGTFNG